MAHRKNTPRSHRPELAAHRDETPEYTAELALARELGRLIGKHLVRQLSERNEPGPRHDRHPAAR